jgi:Fur family ferric uptake transcriptional regulator
LLYDPVLPYSGNENRFHLYEEDSPIENGASTTDKAPLPANYRTVLDVVEQAGPGSHLTAQEIWLRARATQPRIGFATVHRALIRLHETGAVMKVDVPGGAATIYEPAASAHAHFRCTACGGIADVDYAVPRQTLRELARRHGVAIDYEEITFSGRCASCA